MLEHCNEYLLIETKYMNCCKQGKKLERTFKGVANHRRIDILFIINKKHRIILLQGISEKLKYNFKTISKNIKKLLTAGLINKKYQDRQVIQALSPHGEKINNKYIKKILSNNPVFCRMLDYLA